MKTDLQGEVLMANPESVRLLSPIVGSMVENIFEVVDEHDPDLVKLLKGASASGAVVQDRRVSFLTESGETVLSFDVFCSDQKQLLIAFRDVSRLISYERQLELAALTDPLTALPNRRAFRHRLQEEIERHCRHGGSLALVMADADHFKRINDRFGHTGGDVVLKNIAERLKECLRTSDMGARIGGEEFALILPQSDVTGAVECAERAAKLIRAPMPFAEESILCTMSFGVASYQEKESADDFFSRADKALYAAKTGGRDRIEAWTASIAE